MSTKWAVPPTFITDQEVGISQWEPLVHDNLSRLGTRPTVWLGQTPSVTTPNTTWTPFLWAGAIQDTEGMWDPNNSPDSVIIPAGFDGIYMVKGHAEFAAHTGGKARMIALYVNGGLIDVIGQGQAISGTYNAIARGWYPIRLYGGDHVQLYAYQDSGVALLISGENFLVVEWLSQ